MFARNLSATVLPALLVFTLSISASEINRHEIDFSGHWELDYQLSDHPSEKIRHVYVQARSALEREMSRQNSGRYRIDPSMLNLSSIVGLGRLAERIAQATVLNVTQQDGHVVIKRSDDFSLICDFTDMGTKNSVIGVEACVWDEDQLVFEIALPDGLNVLHRLSIASDRSRLNIATTVRISGIRYPFTLNRVYMPFEPGEGLYRCEYTIASQTTCTLGSGEPE